eukprot:754342-Prymnesium_polylepis.2
MVSGGQRERPARARPPTTTGARGGIELGWLRAPAAGAGLAAAQVRQRLQGSPGRLAAWPRARGNEASGGAPAPGIWPKAGSRPGRAALRSSGAAAALGPLGSRRAVQR